MPSHLQAPVDNRAHLGQHARCNLSQAREERHDSVLRCCRLLLRWLAIARRRGHGWRAGERFAWSADRSRSLVLHPLTGRPVVGARGFRAWRSLLLNFRSDHRVCCRREVVRSRSSSKPACVPSDLKDRTSSSIRLGLLTTSAGGSEQAPPWSRFMSAAPSHAAARSSALEWSDQW